MKRIDQTTKRLEKAEGIRKLFELEEEIVANRSRVLAKQVEEKLRLKIQTRQIFLEFYMNPTNANLTRWTKLSPKASDSKLWLELFRSVYGHYPHGNDDPLWNELINEDYRAGFKANDFAIVQSKKVFIKLKFAILRMIKRITPQPQDNSVTKVV